MPKAIAELARPLRGGRFDVRHLVHDHRNNDFDSLELLYPGCHARPSRVRKEQRVTAVT